MPNHRIVDILNEDLGYELAAIMQYMGHHYTAQGLESPSVKDIFKSISIDEMKHAEALAERINYLGGEATTTPTEIKKGGDLRQMIRDDLNAENGAIGRYRTHIEVCEEEGDLSTRRLLEDILIMEEGHADTWMSILGVKK